MYIADCNCNRVVKVDTNGIMTLFAGTGSYVFSGDGGPAVNAGISYPRGVAVDAAGDVLIAVFYDNRIRKVDTNGIITTVAGNGDTVYSGDNISAANATFFYPQGVAVAPNGNLYIADYFHNRIREVAYAGPVLRLSNVSTNNAGNYSVVITNAYGSVTSSVAVLTVNVPVYMVAQPESCQVLAGKSAAFSVTCGGTPPLNYLWRFNGADLAGATESGYTVSPTSTNDAGTYAVVVTNAYGAVTSSVAVLTVVLPPSISAQSGDQTAILGGVAMLSVAAAGPGPYSYQWRCNGTNLQSDFITSIAGTGASGFSGEGVAATNATLYSPNAITVDSWGGIFIADTVNNRIRKIATDGTIRTVAGKSPPAYGGDGGAATNAYLNNPSGVALDALGNIFVADTGNNRVRRIATNGIIMTVAGNGSSAYSGDGGPGTNASLRSPNRVALDASGNLLISDGNNNRIRRLDRSGVITTLAGNGTPSFLGDGGPATNASLHSPTAIAMDALTNLFIADSLNHRIRKVSADGVITTVAGNGSATFSGDGGPATNASLYRPSGLAVNADGSIFLADTSNNRVRRLGTNGIITTVAGTGVASYSGDRGPATNATLRTPGSVAVDASGNLLISDTANNRIREVIFAGIQGIQGPVLLLGPVTLASAGDYDVIVANQYASVTSAVVRVTVGLPPLSATTDPAGAVHLKFSGTPGTTYVLLSSTDLFPPIHWQPLVTNVADSNGAWIFSDRNAPAGHALFYRTTLP
jgi:sugar lactone lactonase YvrE